MVHSIPPALSGLHPPPTLPLPMEGSEEKRGASGDSFAKDPYAVSKQHGKRSPYAAQSSGPPSTPSSPRLLMKQSTSEYLICGYLFACLPACVRAKSLQSCLTLCDPMDCSPPGSSAHGILQARMEQGALAPSLCRQLPSSSGTHPAAVLGQSFLPSLH